MKVNILMVDDHRENLLALEAVLSSLNYNLIMAESGQEALKWVLKEEFAVILLDVQMPGLNGFETAELIKAREKSKDIPIIFVTAISQALDHVNQGYAAGGIDYIFKPFEPDTLLKKVEGFVKMYLTLKQVKEQSELLRQRALELEQAYSELELTSSALHKAEALARAIAHTSIDTILTVDEKGLILSINPAVGGMFGYSAEELFNAHYSVLLPEICSQSCLNSESSHGDFTPQPQAKLVETVALHQDGHLFPVDVSLGQATVDHQTFFVCSIRDITERKALEKERKEKTFHLEKLVQQRTQEIRQTNQRLRLSEKRFRLIFESSPNLMEIRSLKDSRYIDVNESWQKHTGYGYQEIKGKKLDLFKLDLFNHGEKSPHQELRNVRVTYQTKTGEFREGLLSTEIIEIEKETCLLTVVTDVTEQRLLEKEMARLDRLDLIGEMAAGIAHEIRNPMTTVRGFLQLMGASDHHHQSKDIFELMIAELDRGNAIITEFLSLSKSQPLQLKTHNLNSILKSLFPLIQADAFNNQKDVLIDLHPIPDLELDDREIRQMILNLARNGLEAMSSGGTLLLRTYKRGQEVVLAVQDQGSGIAPEVLPKLGTPFFTTKENGTGLGLALCYSIAEKHQARITVKTGPFGTIFSVRFNQRNPQASPDENTINALESTTLS